MSQHQLARNHVEPIGGSFLPTASQVLVMLFHIVQSMTFPCQ